MRIEIDGNDGTGKSTLVRMLAALGIEAQDRGRMTLATDDPSVGPESDVLYILLDLSPAECADRLEAAGKSLEELFHRPADLQHYAHRFRDVSQVFGAVIIPSGAPFSTLLSALSAIEAFTPQHPLLPKDRKPLRIGLPKGRLGSVKGMLGAWGFGTPGVSDRKYLDLHLDSGTACWRLKPRSIPQLVSMGFLEVGFVGRDLLLDNPYDNLVELADLHHCEVRLIAAAQNPDILQNPPTRPLVVATEYGYLADRWLSEQGLSHIILDSRGSTEAFCPSFADLIIDVVETGATLKANGLVEIHEFLHSSTVLISRTDLTDDVRVRAFTNACSCMGDPSCLSIFTP